MLLVATNAAVETQEWGEKLASFLNPGDVIALIGGLGAGKTTMVKGIAKGLGCKDDVTSPTFVLLREYEGRLCLYHFDFYRIEKPEQLYDLDYEDYFYGQGVTIIEWPERVGELLPAEYLRVELNWASKTVRKINFIPFGNHYCRLVKALESQKVRIGSRKNVGSWD